MDKISYAVKIEPGLAERVRKFCLERGVKQGFFVEKALKEQLEREEDVEDVRDFKALHAQEANAISLSTYLANKKK